MKDDKFVKKIVEAIEEAVYAMEPGGIFVDRKRPYNGQPWTDSGTRGIQKVEGLTMRDIGDCLRIALWESAGSPENAVSVYDLDLSEVDPIAISQNLTCNIEKMMGIFPNVPPLQDISEHITWIEIDQENEDEKKD